MARKHCRNNKKHRSVSVRAARLYAQLVKIVKAKQHKWYRLQRSEVPPNVVDAAKKEFLAAMIKSEQFAQLNQIPSTSRLK